MLEIELTQKRGVGSKMRLIWIRLQNYLAGWLFYFGLNFKLAWIAIIPPIFCIFLIFQAKGAESWYRIGGGGLQLIGIASVFYGIAKTRREFGQKSGFSLLRQKIRNVPRWPRSVTITSSATMTGNSEVSGFGSYSWNFPENASNDERTGYLLKWLNESHQISSGLKKEINDLKEELTAKFATEKSDRAASEAEIGSKLENIATGGLDLTIAATVWILVGTILSILSVELNGSYMHAFYVSPVNFPDDLRLLPHPLRSLLELQSWSVRPSPQ